MRLHLLCLISCSLLLVASGCVTTSDGEKRQGDVCPGKVDPTDEAGPHKIHLYARNEDRESDACLIVRLGESTVVSEEFQNRDARPEPAPPVKQGEFQWDESSILVEAHVPEWKLKELEVFYLSHENWITVEFDREGIYIEFTDEDPRYESWI